MKRVLDNSLGRLNHTGRINEVWNSTRSSLNNFSYWYYQLLETDILMPKSVVHPIGFEEFQLLNQYTESHSLSEEEKHVIRQKLIKYLIEPALEKAKDLGVKLFMKNGTFSNKFNFKTCVIDLEKDNVYDILEKFVEIHYTALMYGAGGYGEIVLREFIEPSEKPEIYHGMPLRTEFRIFYDFKKQKPVYVVNYWDFDYCSPHLDGVDKEVFEQERTTMETRFESLKEEAIAYLHNNIIDSKVDVNFIKPLWSVDLMYENGEFILIDMAEAEKSAYYDPEQIRTHLEENYPKGKTD